MHVSSPKLPLGYSYVCDYCKMSIVDVPSMKLYAEGCWSDGTYVGVELRSMYRVFKNIWFELNIIVLIVSCFKECPAGNGYY